MLPGFHFCVIISHKHYSHPDNQDMLALMLAIACVHTNTHTHTLMYKYASLHTHVHMHTHFHPCSHLQYCFDDNALLESQSGGNPDGQNHLLLKGTLNLILRVMDLISQ